MTRFDVVQQFPAPTAPPGTCVVYCAWDRVGFLGFLRASLKSQWTVTDVETVDVKVFVEEDLMEEARRVLAPFPVELLPLETPYTAYSELLHPALARYDRVVRVDADAYFLGRRGTFYADLDALEAEAATGWNHFPPRETLAARRGLSRRFREGDGEEYLTALAGCLGTGREALLERIASGRWCYGVLQVFRRSFLRDEAWRTFIERAAEELATTCHETLFLAYLAAQPKGVADLERLPHFRIAVYDAPRAAVAPGKGLVLVHPLREHGDHFLDEVLRHVWTGAPISRWQAARARWRIARRRLKAALRR